MNKFATLLMQKDKLGSGRSEVRLHTAGTNQNWRAKRVGLLKNNGDSSQLTSSSLSPERSDEIA
jgi:hypothetical protein